MRKVLFPPSLKNLVDESKHSERLAPTLTTLYEGADLADPARLWLTGRAEELTVFVADVLEGWSGGAIPLARACDMIAKYLRSLHLSLESLYGKAYAPTCCGTSGDALNRADRPRLVRGTRARVNLVSRPRDTLPDGADRLRHRPEPVRVLESTGRFLDVTCLSAGSALAVENLGYTFLNTGGTQFLAFTEYFAAATIGASSAQIYADGKMFNTPYPRRPA